LYVREDRGLNEMPATSHPFTTGKELGALPFPRFDVA